MKSVQFYVTLTLICVFITHCQAAISDELLQTILKNITAVKEEADKALLQCTKHDAMVTMDAGPSKNQEAFHCVQGLFGSSPIAVSFSCAEKLQLKVLHIIKDRFQLSKNEIIEVTKSLAPLLHRKVTSDVSPHVEKNPKPSECPFGQPDGVVCDEFQRYRTIDGSCNNLKHPLWGRAFRSFLRFLDPDYADGIEEPRASSTGAPLVSPRRVSMKISKGFSSLAPVHTFLLMNFGQFLDHDITLTPISTLMTTDSNGQVKTVKVECGKSGCETDGEEKQDCFPIPIPHFDRDFINKECLMFVRSAASPPEDCKVGPREQLNQITAYLDASNVYGSSKERNQELRDASQPDRGRLYLETNPAGFKGMLPFAEDEECRDTTDKIHCFLAGDNRRNEHPGLMSLHTTYHRYHNVIEEKLHHINPHWGGERLYQESRRIVIASWEQHVFNEYLPTVLGPQIMQRYGLVLEKCGYWNGYDSHLNPEIRNAFAAAAFRFGHSSIPDFLHVVGKDGNVLDKHLFSEVFNRPTLMYEEYASGTSPIDAIVRALFHRPMEIVNKQFTKQITTRLFSENPPNGLGTDLVSLNIQRGRDHGIPGYCEWRQWCGLSVPKRFKDMKDMPKKAMRQLRKLYDGRLEDVDLYPAAISERPVPGGVVGPTFACIIAQQFRNLRAGDRFWYEREDPVTGFSLEQLKEIRKSRISRVICDTADDVGPIQPFVLLQPVTEAFKNLETNSYQTVYSYASLYQGGNNERVSCSELPTIDLEKWKDFA